MNLLKIGRLAAAAALLLLGSRYVAHANPDYTSDPLNTPETYIYTATSGTNQFNGTSVTLEYLGLVPETFTTGVQYIPQFNVTDFSVQDTLNGGPFMPGGTNIATNFSINSIGLDGFDGSFAIYVGSTLEYLIGSSGGTGVGSVNEIDPAYSSGLWVGAPINSSPVPGSSSALVLMVIGLAGLGAFKLLGAQRTSASFPD